MFFVEVTWETSFESIFYSYCLNIVSAPLFVPVAPTNPSRSQLLIPPSFVALFNRRLTTNDFTNENHFSQQSSFRFHLNEDNNNHRQRPVSVITLSSDEDDKQPPPRVAPPHPQSLNSNSNRSNIKRERISIDHRTQYGMTPSSSSSSSLSVDRLNSHNGLLDGFVSNDPRSIQVLMYRQIDRNDIRFY